MPQLKVIIIGTSPAETLRLEETLRETGSLHTFRYIGLEQAAEHIPNWQDWDLLIARYQERTGDLLLAVLAPVLRTGTPPVLVLTDAYEPRITTRLLNSGAVRVLPVAAIETLLQSNLNGIFGASRTAARRLSSPGSQPAPDGFSALNNFLPSDEGFARLFRASPVGISIHRLQDGICLDCNESLAQLLEWPCERLIGQNLIELGINEDIQSYFKNGSGDPRASGTQEKPALRFERKIFTRSRQVRHVQINLDLIDWNGEACVLSLVQDLTEKEQVKEKIKRLNDQLEKLVLVRTGALEAANRELAAEIGRRRSLEDFSNQLSQIIWETPDVVAIFAPEGRMQFLNKAGRALFSLNEDASVSHLDLFSLYSETTRMWIREKILPVVVRDGIWRGESTFELPDGRVIPVSQVLVCKKNDGGVQYFAITARDVTDFKHVEQELRQSRERYRTLAEAARDLIFVVSPDGLMEYANGFACQVLGLDPASIEGMPASQFFPKDFASYNLPLFSDVHEIDRPIYTEGPFLVDAQQLWLGTWLVPIHNGDGSLTSIMGISRDITEQKKTDEALQRALQNERKLNELRSNFFSMTSHQFRTPLSTILLSTEMLQKYGHRWDEAKRAEHLARIQEASLRLNSMLEDILMIGRVESGRYVCTPKDFDLIAFCEKIIAEISTIDQNERTFVFKHEDAALPVYQDMQVMQRVIDNLLSNAVKYSPAGSQVLISIQWDGTDVVLQVTDQGIGIPEDDIKYLFQPFQRGSNAGDYPGTGIGLTIIQKSVELMNGSISLKSKVGYGTSFTLRFPARFENIMRQTAALSPGK